MTGRRLPRLCRLLLGMHLLLAATLALFNPHAHLLDDAYYTLTVARHLAAGEGLTYGSLPTNGFQPLYAFLMTPAMMLCGDHPEWCLRLALLLMACCSTGLLYVLMRLALHLAGARAAVMVGILSAANANLLSHGLSGLETPLHGLLFWLFVLLYLRHREGAGFAGQAGLGLLLALTAYARFDSVFLFVAVGVDLAWRYRKDFPTMLKRGLALFTPAILALAPWFIWSRSACGSFFQSSGAFHRWRGLLGQDLPESILGLVKFAAAKLASLGVKLPLEPLIGYQEPMRLLSRALLGEERMRTGFLVQMLNERPAAAALLILVGLTAAVAVLWFGRKPLKRLAALQPLRFLLIGLAGAALFYPLYLLNYSMRHFYPYSMGMVLVWAAVLAGRSEDTEPDRKIFRGVIGAVLLIALALPGLRVWLKSADDTVPRDLLTTIERSVAPGAKIGYTDCGVFGWYLPRHTVMNLDGILNFEALRAMQTGDIGAFLEKHKVEYVLYLHNFKTDFADQWQRDIAPRVEPVPPTDWLYRLLRSGK